jgi:hypothetical protein
MAWPAGPEEGLRVPCSFSWWVAPRPGSLVYSEGLAFEKEGELSGGDGGGGGQLGECEQDPQAPTLEAARDQIQSDTIAEQRSQLGLIALDEKHAVAVVGLGAELIRLSEKPIEALAEVDSVLREQHPADGDRQHGSQRRVVSVNGASRTHTDQGPRRSSRS